MESNSIVNVGTVGIMAVPGLFPVTLRAYYCEDNTIHAFMECWRRGHKYVRPISYNDFQKVLNAAYPRHIACEYIETVGSSVIQDIKNERYLEHRKEVKPCVSMRILSTSRAGQ